MSTEIDITDVVEKSRQTFVEWGVLYLSNAVVAIPGWQWLAMPVIRNIFQSIIRWVLNKLSESVVMGAFFLNTAINKATEAKVYVDAVNAKNSLPDDVTDEDYEKHERAEMDAFVRFATIV